MTGYVFKPWPGKGKANCKACGKSTRLAVHQGCGELMRQQNKAAPPRKHGPKKKHKKYTAEFIAEVTKYD
jgi:hypothetical protein